MRKLDLLENLKVGHKRKYYFQKILDIIFIEAELLSSALPNWSLGTMLMIFLNLIGKNIRPDRFSKPVRSVDFLLHFSYIN